MKKLVCILLALLLTASLAGCGSTKAEVDLTGKDLIRPSAEPENPPAEEETGSAPEDDSEETPEESAEPEIIEPIEIVSFEDSGDFQIGILTDETCAIIGYSGKSEYLEIPETLNDKTVVSIGERAFYNNNHIKTLIIPGCITDIGKEAFAACGNLSSLTLNEGLLRIGESAFISCGSLLGVKIPDSVRKIDGFAFKGCEKLQELTLPQNIKGIEHCSFAMCTSLENVVIPESVESIGAWAFAWTPWEEGLEAAAEEWLELGQGACYVYTGSAEEIIVPAEYQTYEFCGNTGIRKITLSEGITAIPGYSCEALKGLKEILIPSTIKTVGECAFRNTKVGELSFAPGLERIERSAFESSGNIILHLPDSVSFIDEEAFINCGSVTLICSPESYAAEYAQAHGYSTSAE